MISKRLQLFFLVPPPLLSRTMNKRLTKELGELTNEPLPFTKGVGLTGDNLYKWKVTILGPDKTPYEKGVFQIELDIPTEYPFKPPKLKFVTKIYHPNVKSDGGFCADILSESWSPQLKISDVLNTVDKLMKDPNPENPLEPEIANQYKADRATFTKTAKEWTKKYAK